MLQSYDREDNTVCGHSSHAKQMLHVTEIILLSRAARMFISFKTNALWY